MSNKELLKMKEDFLLNLDKEELQSYIDNLIKDYYNNYLANNNDALKDNVIDLMRLPSLFEDIYPNMSNYINYRLVVLSNKVFESIFDGRSELFYPLDNTPIDYEPNTNLSNLFDDKLMMKILFESKMNHIHEFMEFVEYLPSVRALGNYEKKIPRVLVNEVTEFMEGVKSGAYDGYLEIPEDVISDENPYDKLEGD